ncbi:MAG: trigger factor [Calditrichales bacterium]|nr:MAG: trigger factor [Calditrichales bacterium]
MVATVSERLSSCKMKIEITLQAERIDSIRKTQEVAAQKEAQIQGFRKGKAPMHMVKGLYAGTIEKNTLDEAMQQAYEEGLKESKIIPVGYPVIKNFDYDDDKNLKIEVEIEVNPEIELKKYKNLSFERIIYKIEDSDVEENINYILKQRAVVLPVNDPAHENDIVTFSLQELDQSGAPLIGKKYNDIRVQLGQGQFDPDLEAQIISAKTGEERMLEKVYPKSAGKDLVGKVEKYQAAITKVEKEEKPELNDKFVEDLNLDIKTVNDFRTRVREELEHRWGQESEQHFYHHVVQELLHENPFDAPDTMIDNYLDHIVEDVRNREKKINEDAVRKHYRADATFNVKWFHLKDKIAEVENIESTEEDYAKFLEELNDEKVKKLYESNPDFKKRAMSDIFEKKIFDFLIKSSKVKEKKQSIKQGKDIG